MIQVCLQRGMVFGLAFLSFACLLGQFYGLWSMAWFGCWVLPPSTLALMGIAAWYRRQATGVHNPSMWIMEGALGGVLAACVYDLYRVPFVLMGAPLFRVFPRFGELLLGADEPRWLVHLLGWTYHFSNGAALGIMLLAMLPTMSRRWLFWGSVAWALWIEACLLLTPYPTFFGLAVNGQFIFLTASAHLIFGLSLGGWLRYRLGTVA